MCVAVGRAGAVRCSAWGGLGGSGLLRWCAVGVSFDAEPEGGFWRLRAECRGCGAAGGAAHPFFPRRGGQSAELAAARRLCAVCRVRRECLVVLLSGPSEGYDYGVWGGLSGHQRRAMGKRAVEALAGL